jgi:hypothetical protein
VRATWLPALLVAGSLASAAATKEPPPRKFSIPGHGDLILNVPADWRVVSAPLDEPPALNIRVSPVIGDAFSLHVTSVWLDPARAPAPSRSELEERVRKAASGMLSKAVEKEPTILELRGKQTSGYYFSLTDKEATGTAGDFRHVMQGIVITGAVTTAFTFLHQDSAVRSKEDVLRMLRAATYSETSR